MPPAYSQMVDTIHADVSKIPTDDPYVAGYVSGTSDIDWTSGDWARFHQSTKVRIYQGFGSVGDVHSFDVLDVENLAVTPQEAANIIEERVNAGIGWTCVYGGDTSLAEVTRLTKLKGDHIWIGHVEYWFADWNLDQAEAINMLGTLIHGATCRAVQWASSSSNPETIVYGGTATLRECNADLSVVQAGWVPSFTPPKPTPPVPPQPTPPPAKTATVHFGDGFSHTGPLPITIQ